MSLWTYLNNKMSQLRCYHSRFVCLCLLVIGNVFEFFEYPLKGGFAIEKPDTHPSISHSRLQNPPSVCVIKLFAKIPQFITPLLIKFVNIRYLEVPSPWDSIFERRLIMFRQIWVDTSWQEMLSDKCLPNGVAWRQNCVMFVREFVINGVIGWPLDQFDPYTIHIEFRIRALRKI